MAVVSNGTTIIDAGALGSGVATGKMTLIKTLTASGSGTLSFVDGAASVVLDNTYDSYVFKFINIHPSVGDLAGLTFQVSTDGGSSYGIAITSTYFRPTHNEDGGSAALVYQASQDLAQSTAYQNITSGDGIENDESASGTLTIYNPSDTTFVKHFIANTNTYHGGDKTRNPFTAGYINSTSAVDAIQFKYSSGNFDGVIKLYGIGG